MKQGSRSRLPPSLPPRGLSREQAAEYVGVSPGLFDQMVRDGRMPQAFQFNSRRVWDRVALDAVFAPPGAANEDGGPNPLDEMV